MPYFAIASVCTNPGAIATRRTPRGPHSTASVRVSDSTAARAADECAMPGVPRCGDIVMLMILP